MNLVIMGRYDKVGIFCTIFKNPMCATISSYTLHCYGRGREEEERIKFVLRADYETLGVGGVLCVV